MPDSPPVLAPAVAAVVLVVVLVVVAAHRASASPSPHHERQRTQPKGFLGKKKKLRAQECISGDSGSRCWCTPSSPLFDQPSVGDQAKPGGTSAIARKIIREGQDQR